MFLSFGFYANFLLNQLHRDKNVEKCICQVFVDLKEMLSARLRLEGNVELRETGSLAMFWFDIGLNSSEVSEEYFDSAMVQLKKIFCIISTACK